MARMGGPWRVMMLAGVFALAACEVGVDAAVPAVSGVDTESIATTHAETAVRTELATVVESGVESLVVMSGPASDDGLLGAGCVAEPDEPLPDGDWFGFVLETHDHYLVVDIACVYGPETDQFQAFAQDTAPAWSSYVVVNDVVAERPLRFGPASQAYMAAENWQPRSVREVAQEAQADPDAAPRGVWLRIEDGRIAALVEPYTTGVAAD